MIHRKISNTLTASVVVAALSFACAKQLPVEPPLDVGPLTFASGEWRAIDQVVVVTDASGTMYSRETFPQAKALTQSFVKAMPDTSAPAANPGRYDAGLVSFGGEERITAAIGAFDRAALAATAESLRILGSIDGMGGETPYRHLFPEIQGTLPALADGGTKSAAKGAVVVFSDGLADRPDAAILAAGALSAGYDGEICFHTVQVGDDPLGAEYLRALAGLTPCGSHRTADSVGSPAAFSDFVRQVFSGAAPPVSDACGGVIRLRGVEFDFDKSAVRPDSAVVLDEAASQLNTCPEVKIRVEGHTDWTGTEQYNQGLSERRADSVKGHLSGAGVAAGRMSTVGFGESRPIAPNESKDGRARNRRVELHAQ